MATLEERIQLYLAEHSTLAIATQGPDGPWSAAVFYVHQDWNLYFFSKESSRHSSDLATTPKGAGTIYDETFQWTDIKGLQVTGRVEEVRGLLEKTRVLQLFDKKYDFFSEMDMSELLKAGRGNRFYRFALETVKMVDNSLGFGHKEELRIADIEA